MDLRKRATNLPQTLHANSGNCPSGLFKSGCTEAGAGDGDFLFLTTGAEFVPLEADEPAVFRFLRLFGSEGFIKLLRILWLSCEIRSKHSLIEFRCTKTTHLKREQV